MGLLHRNPPNRNRVADRTGAGLVDRMPPAPNIHCQSKRAWEVWRGVFISLKRDFKNPRVQGIVALLLIVFLKI
jgi:hypothetical protein